MSDNRDLFVNEPPDQIDAISATFELDRLGTAVFHQAKRILDALVLIYVIGAERHIGNDHRPLGAAFDGDACGCDLFERNGDSVAVSVNNIADTVADEDHIDASLVYDTSRRIVIGGQTDQFLAVFLCCTYRGKVDLALFVWLEVCHKVGTSLAF